MGHIGRWTEQEKFGDVVGSRLVKVYRRGDKIHYVFQVEDYQPEPQQTDTTPYADIVALYHEYLPMASRVKTLTDRRKRAIKARWNEEVVLRLKAQGKEVNDENRLKYLEAFFKQCSQSKFLTGRVAMKNGEAFIANLDFLFTPTYFTKVLEGFYNRNDD